MTIKLWLLAVQIAAFVIQTGFAVASVAATRRGDYSLGDKYAGIQTKLMYAVIGLMVCVWMA